MRASRSRSSRRSTAAILLLIGLLLPAVAAGQDLWSPPTLPEADDTLPDPRAVVQAAIDHVQGLTAFRFEALVTYEVTQAEGHKLQFDMLQRIAIRRPDRMHWEVLEDDGNANTAWLDRGDFTLARQPANVWGHATVPPSLPEAIDRLSEDYGIVVPFVDLVSGEAQELWLGEAVQAIAYIGEAWINGRWTDHIGIHKDGVDIQLWFQQGDAPFPVKMAVVRTDEAGAPGFMARFTAWDPQVTPDEIPDFVVPEGAQELELAP